MRESQKTRLPPILYSMHQVFTINVNYNFKIISPSELHFLYSNEIDEISEIVLQALQSQQHLQEFKFFRLSTQSPTFKSMQQQKRGEIGHFQFQHAWFYSKSKFQMHPLHKWLHGNMYWNSRLG